MIGSSIRTWTLENEIFPRQSERISARSLGDQLPRIVLEARRIASAFSGGVHGRRQAGAGDSFWQFRPFSNGEPASRIDWRRSGRDNRLYVREREWQSPQTFWIWMDRSRSMQFRSSLAQTSKVERALVLGLALAYVLMENGEQVGLLGSSPAHSSHTLIDYLSEHMLLDKQADEQDLPPPVTVPSRHEVLLIGDFLSPITEIQKTIDHITMHNARGHMILIYDPVEETFPFQGQTLLEEPETNRSLRIGNAAEWAPLYQKRFESHKLSLKHMISQKGWSFSVHHTDHSASEIAMRVLSLLSAAHRISASEV